MEFIRNSKDQVQRMKFTQGRLIKQCLGMCRIARATKFNYHLCILSLITFEGLLIGITCAVILTFRELLDIPISTIIMTLYVYIAAPVEAFSHTTSANKTCTHTFSKASTLIDYKSPSSFAQDTHH